LYLDPTKKRGPPKGAGRYINAIEDRLHRMEAIVGGLVREDDPLFTGDELRNLLVGAVRGRVPRDSYHEQSDMERAPYPQGQSYYQHPGQSDLDHQHNPPALQDYSGMTQQQQHQPSMQQGHQHPQIQIQYPQQQLPPPPQQQPQSMQQSFMQQQQNRQHQQAAYPMQLSQMPEVSARPRPEGFPQQTSQSRPNSMHRELMRENTFRSFSSPSPILESDKSVGDFADSPTSTEALPTLGINTPPVQEVDELEEDMGHLTLDQLGRGRYVGSSSPMFWAQRHFPGSDPTPQPEPEQEEALKHMHNVDLPSAEVMTHLLNLHFTYVHPFAPVFIWSKFLKRLQEQDYTPSFLFLLNSIFALASRFSDDVQFRKDPADPETCGVQFADKAREILDTLYTSPDLNCVGALVLLAYQQMGTGSGYRAWMHVGISIRMAQHLGLNRDCKKLDPNMHPLDCEERNRIWWTCFSADRLISTSFGRPQGIAEYDMDAKYPEGIDEEDIMLEYRLCNSTTLLNGPSPDSEKNFLYFIGLLRILGRVMVSLYSPLSKSLSKSTTSMTNPAPLEQLDKELTDWLLTLPPHLQFRSVQQEEGTFVCTLHMLFYEVLILLHRPYSHQSSHHTTNDPSISLSICTSAANNTIEMASNMMRSIDENRGTARIKCMLHYCVLIMSTAGAVHVTNCTSTDPILAASAKMRTIETLRCMAALEDVWVISYWCADNLKRLLKARNIQLPYTSEDFKNLPLGSVEDMKKKHRSSSPMDVATASVIPKEQSFAFDVDQIMGYYQGSAAKHTQPQGRNSRLFSPTPYFNPITGHAQSLKTHPGLRQGQAPQPRRPRLSNKNTMSSATSPGTNTITSTSSSLPSNNGFFSVMPGASQIAGFENGNGSGAQSNSVEAFVVPGSATVTNGELQDSPIESPVNSFQNPFSSSLWGLPTSMDPDDWMLYMQNGGGASDNGLDLGLEGDGGGNSQQGGGTNINNANRSGLANLLKADNPGFFRPPTEFNSGLADQNGINMVTSAGNAGSQATSVRSRPLTQSMSSQDLLASSVAGAGLGGGTSRSPIPISTATSSASILSTSVSSSIPSSITSTNSGITHSSGEYHFLGQHQMQQQNASPLRLQQQQQQQLP
ncbi:hypothetical protein BGZ99_000332, partial [Dissophora globulifera]